MIILSCGHQVEDMDGSFPVIIKEYARDGSRALAYKSVCLTCKKLYEKEKALFPNQRSAYAWLLDAE